MPVHLAGKVNSIDYGICLANNESSIGKLIKNSDFQVDPFLDELGKIFMQVIGDMGIKNLPSKATEQRIIHYIVNYYKDFSLQEIRKAFELAIVEELMVDAEHYHSFDIKYICKILNAYRRRRIKAKEILKRNTHLLENTVTEEQKQQAKQAFIKTVCLNYDKYAATGEWGYIPLTTVYDLLIEEGILNPQKNKKEEEVVLNFFKECIQKRVNFHKILTKTH